MVYISAGVLDGGGDGSLHRRVKRAADPANHQMVTPALHEPPPMGERLRTRLTLHE